MPCLLADKKGHASFIRAAHGYYANGDIKSAGEMTK